MLYSIASKIAEDVRLARYTTYRIGGPARYFLTVTNNEELTEGVQWCREYDVPWFLLGAGSNILISDIGFLGLVMKLCGEFDFISIDEDEGVVTAGGAVLLPRLANVVSAQGWNGLSSICDIPGTIGGGVRINAGTRYGEVKDVFISARVMTQEGREETITCDEAVFSYRHSAFVENKSIVLSAKLRLGERENPAEIRNRNSEIRRKRRLVQPANRRNCGSVFKKPAGGGSAGWYIEQAGLKGARIGDAMVAQEHANWILNMGMATSEDVKKLVKHVQERVLAKFGIKLVREVIYVPDDEN